MKKIVAYSLVAIMLVTLVFSSAVFASPVVVEGKGEEIYNYNNNGTQIIIYREHTERSFLKFGKKYDTCITLEVSKGVDGIKSYTSQKVSSFFSKPLSVKKVCKKDDTLKKADIFTKIETLCMYDEIMRNPAAYLKSLGVESFEEMQQNTIDDISGIVDEGSKEIVDEFVKTVANDSIKNAIGIDTSIWGILSSSAGAKLFTELIADRTMSYVEIFRLIQDIATEGFSGDKGEIKDKFDKLLRNAENDLFAAICEIAE